MNLNKFACIKYFFIKIFNLLSRFCLSQSIASTFSTNSSYPVFLKTSLSTTLLRLFKSVGAVSNSSVSNLPTPNFKQAKLTFLAKSDVSIPVSFSRHNLVA